MAVHRFWAFPHQTPSAESDLCFCQDICGEALQLHMTFNLRDKAAAFMAELWPLLVSAQESKNGVSPQLEEAAEEVSATCKVIFCSRFRVLEF
jgi:hypothetical protein